MTKIYDLQSSQLLMNHRFWSYITKPIIVANLVKIIKDITTGIIKPPGLSTLASIVVAPPPIPSPQAVSLSLDPDLDAALDAALDTACQGILTLDCDDLSKPSPIPVTVAQGGKPLSPFSSLSSQHFNSQIRLLVVDDHAINQKVAQGLLQQLGLKSEIVSDGQEAIETLKGAPLDNPYTLVFMDCQMPEMDGYETTRQIRQGVAGATNQNIPIIAMTANAMEGDREKCLAAGMSDYISKPLNPQLLDVILRQWLDLEQDSGSDSSRQDITADGDRAKTLERSTPQNTKQAMIMETKTSEMKTSEMKTSETSTSIEDSNDRAQGNNPEKIPIFDPTVFLQNCGNDRALTAQVGRFFLEDILEEIDSLKQYLRAEESYSLVCKAHGIKGLAAHVGGKALRTIALKLEEAAIAEDLTMAQTYIPALEYECSQLQIALKQWLSTLNA